MCRVLFVKNVLLTGGTGFVGANLALRLLHQGHGVALIVRPGCAMWRLQSFADDNTASMCVDNHRLILARKIACRIKARDYNRNLA